MPNKKAKNSVKRTSKQELRAARNAIVSIFVNSKRRKKTAIIVAAVLVLWVGVNIAAGGGITFYAKWISCGQKPVGTTGPGLFSAGVPHYVTEPAFTLIRFHSGEFPYYCSPRDAELHGYSANENQYEFPDISYNENISVREEYLLPR
ncbi:MAG TPA: hypothetical protein VFQ70_03415 [Candidatus Saccharimonadaceae bacterium]|nr:hypothetical protein [Candidatus Saccharimonadaceae bacterium]